MLTNKYILFYQKIDKISPIHIIHVKKCVTLNNGQLEEYNF